VSSSRSDPGDNRKVIDYWENAHAMGDADTFLAHPMVQAYVSIRADRSLAARLDVAGDEIERRTSPGDRVVSVGCGAAGKEMVLAQRFPDRQFVGLDIAEGTLANGRDTAAEKGIANLDLEVGDFNDLRLQVDSVAMILGLGAIHHVANLEAFWTECGRALRPGGSVVAQEYVGPSRFQWTRAQLELCNAAMDELVPEDHKVHHTVVERVPVEIMLELDPSEAVRSDEILATCREQMEVVDYRGAGCSLLQPILVDQLHTFEPRNWRHNRILAELFAREDELMRAGVLGDSFAMFVAT
jgi:SAM-dependent methyltransferase